MRIAAAAVAFGALGAAFTPLPPKFFNEPASPWSKPSAPLPIQPSEQDLAGVLLCTGPNSTGLCEHQVYALDRCQQLPPPFRRNTSTFAVDGEDFFCFPRVYDCGQICTSPTGCTFGQVDFGYEHKYDLGAIGWNTLIQSFDCSLKRSS